MGKIFKIIASLLVAVILLLVVAAVALPLLVDPNDFRDEISTLVEEQTGRKLQIEGEIGFSVFPWLGIELGSMELSNAPGFGTQAFAGIERADLKIKLLPLLRKQVEIKTIVLHGLNVNLARDKSGKTNWDDLVSSEQEQTPPEPAKESPSATLESLQVSGIEIRNARLSWDDQQSGARYAVENLNLETGALNPGQPFPLKLELDGEASKPAVRAHVKFASNITFDLERETYLLDSPRIVLNAKGDIVPGGDIELTLDAGSISADLKQQLAQLKGLNLFVAGARLTGQVDVNQLLDKQSIKGAIKLALEKPELLQQFLGEEPPPVKLEALQGTVLTTAFNADLGSQQLKLDNLKLQTLGTELTATVNGQQIIDKPKFNGTLNLAQLNLRQLLKQLAIEIPATADPAVLQSIAMNLDFAATTENAEIPKLNLKLDDTTLTGSAGVNNFSKPAIRFDLSIDGIDADRYLPPPAEEPEPAPQPAAKKELLLPDFELPLEPLRELNLQGKLQLGKLKISGLHAADILLAIKARDGVLELDPLSTALYGGNLTTRLTLDARQDQAKMKLQTRLAGLQAGPLLKDLVKEDYISGKADINLNLRAQGATFLQLRKTMNGKAAFSFQNGAVKGINLGQMLRKAYATLSNQPLPKQDEPIKTDFSELGGTFTIVNGVVTNKDLSAKAPALRIRGEGTVNLVTEKIDYRISTSIVGTVAGQGGENLDKLKGLTIPVRITGTFAKPKIKEDLTSALKAKTQAEIDKKKKELEAKLKAEERKAKAKLEAEKAKAKAQVDKKKKELEAKAKAEEAKAKAKLDQEKKKAEKKLEDELKKKAGELFKF